jgi:Zn-dependent peptidase ImmA (M78 family)
MEDRGAPIMCRAEEVGVGEGRALEREANVFAAELLMPSFYIRSAWDDLGEVDGVAARFAVSPTAMQWRLFSFRLVDQKPDR